MTIGLVLAGGTGQRFGGDIPKQYLMINSKMVIEYAICALRDSLQVDKIVVVCDKQALQIKELLCSYDFSVANAGSSRNQSIKNGLDYISDNYKCSKIMILDSARPLVTAQLVDDYLIKLDDYDSVITGQKIVDSLGCYDVHYIDREKYYLVQAPEAFRFDKLFDSFVGCSNITATNQQLPDSSNIYINFDMKINLKITYKTDLTVASILLNDV